MLSLSNSRATSQKLIVMILINATTLMQSLSNSRATSQKLIVMILINATTLMHKSNLSRNNFGNNHFGQ